MRSLSNSRCVTFAQPFCSGLKSLAGLALAIALLASNTASAQEGVTPTPSATPTASPTATATGYSKRYCYSDSNRYGKSVSNRDGKSVSDRYGKSVSDRYGKSVGDTNRDANTWRLGNPKSHANTSRIPNANATF